jgi:PAS domain S-box-containing protein
MLESSPPPEGPSAEIPDALREHAAEIPWGEHLCLVYDRTGEPLSAAAAFLAAGLRHGERCAYVVDEHTFEQVTRALRTAGVDVAREKARGALVLTEAVEYGGIRPFDPARMCERLRGLVDEALRADFSGLRLAVDMTWTLRQGIDPGRLVEYEAMTNALVFARGHIAAICMYNRSRFPEAMIEHVLAAHPAVVSEAAAGRIWLGPHGRTSLRIDQGMNHSAPDGANEGPETEDARIERAIRQRTAQEETSTAKRLAFLAEVGRILSSSLDFETTLRSVARLATPTVADYCIVDLVDEDGSIRRVATAHRDPGHEALTASLCRFPPDPLLPGGVPKVLFTGEPLMVAEVEDEVLRAATRGEEHLRIVHELGPRSFLIVPLNARGRTLGAITLGYTDSGRRYGPHDLALAEELAGHAALALDNARLHRDAQAEIAARKEAREQLDHQHAFLQLLLEITTAANEAPSFREALRIALDRIRAHTRWPIGHAWVPAPDGHLESSGLWSTEDPERFQALLGATRELSLPPGIGLPGRVLAGRRAVGIVDVTSDPTFLRAHVVSDLGVKAAFAFPVLVGSEVVSVLEFFSGRAVEVSLEFLEVMAHVGMQLGRVAERERAEKAVREGEARFRQIAENLRDVLWISDPGFARVLYVSPAYDDVWGRPSASLQDDPQAWIEAILPEDRERVHAFLQAPSQEGHEIEYRILRPGGELRWLKSRAFPVADEAGEVVRIVGITEDITEGKRAERERARLLALEQEAREKAEDAVRTRDDVLRIAAHDLKNPIHTIKLSADLLVEVTLSDEQRAQQFEVIRRTADHMNRLVQGLLDLKRLEAGHGIPIEPRPTGVPSLLSQGHSLFEAQAQAKGIGIVREMPEAGVVVRADPDRILQVLWNLTGNAIKFTQEGGRVIIRAEEQSADVLLSVADTGPGIAPEDRDRLFDPFWQDKRTARLGTGLGLPISKAIVEAHGGRIWVESAPRAGSTFFFTLPKA